MHARALGLIACAALLAACAPTTATDSVIVVAEPVELSLLDVGGVSRSYIVHAPSDARPGEPLPLLIVLHGAGGDATTAENATGFTGDADDDGFIVAYPNGTAANAVAGELAWNAGACCGLPRTRNVDDSAFITALVAELAATFPVDAERVFLAGFSNGGMMSHQLACQYGDAFAGIAVVGGALNYEPCEPPTPVSVLIMHGASDATVPYDGGPTNDRTALRFGQWHNTSVEFATRFWAANDQCAVDPVVTTEATLSVDSYRGCALGSRVQVATIADGTHSWPRLETTGVDGSELILEFFGLN